MAFQVHPELYPLLSLIAKVYTCLGSLWRLPIDLAPSPHYANLQGSSSSWLL